MYFIFSTGSIFFKCWCTKCEFGSADSQGQTRGPSTTANKTAQVFVPPQVSVTSRIGFTQFLLSEGQSVGSGVLCIILMRRIWVHSIASLIPNTEELPSFLCLLLSLHHSRMTSCARHQAKPVQPLVLFRHNKFMKQVLLVAA